MTSLLEALAIETGIGTLDIRRIAAHAPVSYKLYRIPKRKGGFRTIAQPTKEVKILQRAVVSVVLDKLPIHDAATAYRSGRSILDNARVHAENGPILKLDLKEFFPSLLASDWYHYCQKSGVFGINDDIKLSTQLLFWRDPARRGLRLAIGAPSSPALSNVLMFRFDELVFGAVASEYVSYTRYADDMTFSAPRTGFLAHVKSKVCHIIRELRSPNLELNDSKTTYVTKKYHRTVTGLTLANDGRVTIGRDRKRLVSASLHRAKQGKLSPAEQQVLAGVLAYINAVEPTFLDTLRRKYGREILDQIRQVVTKGFVPPPHSPPIAAL